LFGRRRREQALSLSLPPSFNLFLAVPRINFTATKYFDFVSTGKTHRVGMATAKR
jgi:hypothetical protein